jgi:hypothetical protein
VKPILIDKAKENAPQDPRPGPKGGKIRKTYDEDNNYRLNAF